MKCGLVIPAWNAVRWIKDTLESIREQSVGAWCAIVVDDGSTDATREVVETWIRYYARALGGRVSVDTVPHGGLAKAVNFGLRSAHFADQKPDVVGCLGADDRLSARYVSVMLEPFKANAAVLCTYPRIQEFGTRGLEWVPGPWTPNLLAEKNCVPGCAFWRVGVWHKLQGFDERFTAGLEDWHFAARAEQVGLLGPYNRPQFVPQAIYYHRARLDSLTDQMTTEYRVWAEKQIRDLYPEKVTRFVHVPQSKPATLIHGPIPLE